MLFGRELQSDLNPTNKTSIWTTRSFRGSFSLYPHCELLPKGLLDGAALIVCLNTAVTAKRTEICARIQVRYRVALSRTSIDTLVASHAAVHNKYCIAWASPRYVRYGASTNDPPRWLNATPGTSKAEGRRGTVEKLCVIAETNYCWRLKGRSSESLVLT